MNICIKILQILIKSLKSSYAILYLTQRGRLDPIFHVQRKLWHVSLYIILSFVLQWVFLLRPNDLYEINLIPKKFLFPAYSE